MLLVVPPAHTNIPLADATQCCLFWGPVAPGEAQDGAVLGDTHPAVPVSLCHVVPTLDQARPALGGAGPGLRGGHPAAADGEGTQVPQRRQHRGHRVGVIFSLG